MITTVDSGKKSSNKPLLLLKQASLQYTVNCIQYNDDYDVPLWNPHIMIFIPKREAHTPVCFFALGPPAGHICVVRSRLLVDLMPISGTNVQHLSENTRVLPVVPNKHNVKHEKN